MMIFLLACYIAILALFVWLKFIPLNNFWKFSPLIVLLLLNLGLFIPMGWGAPQGSALVIRNSVSIIPDVSGQVTDVPVTPNKPIKAGDVLFRIDPTTYESQAKTIEAQLKFQELRLSQMTQLQSRDAGRAFDVEQRQSEVEELRAKLEGAKWNLDRTVVRAPADGYVTNVTLRTGARVSTAPAMAFIDTSETLIGVEVAQIYARYIQPGQRVEATFKFFPGRVYPGKVVAVLQAIASGQAPVTGQAVTPVSITAAPFVVRVRLDDQSVANALPAGATGDAAIFTDHVKAAHVIRKVLLRQIAIMNYIIPF